MADSEPTEVHWTEDGIREFVRIRDKVDRASGPGVTNLPTSITINPPPPRVPQAPPPEPPEIRHVIVAEANVATNPIIQLVKDSASSTKTYPVVSLCKMATNDELYVFRPLHGVINSPTYTDSGDTTDVIWRDCRLPGVYDVALTGVGGSLASNPADRTYDLKLSGYPTTVIATAQSPTWRPYAGRITSAAAEGQAYIDEMGVATLRVAYEGLSPAAC